MTEAQLHRAVAEYLDLVLLPPAWWSTFPSGGGGKARGGQLKGRGLKPGVPDILLVQRGECFWIELKATNGRLSKAQQDTSGALAAAGCHWTFCRSIEQVAEALKYWGISTRQAALT